MANSIREKVVAAIDFGTCNTRIAFALLLKKDTGTISRINAKTKMKDIDIYVVDNWKSSPIPLSPVVPTSVLIDPSMKAIAYGHDAEQQLRTVDKTTHYYFKHFKMELHKINDFSPTHMLTSLNGKKMPAINVIAEALAFLKTELLKYIKSKTGIELSTNEIRWVLTVPAIWTMGARHVMRKAAYKAKLCEEETSDSLIIALEPECAALYVRKREDCKPEDLVTQYAVVDCGGGTLDIAYHSIENISDDTFVVKELTSPSGGPFGGILVDQAFEKEILVKIFGAEIIKQVKEKHTNAWLAVMKAFEETKSQLKDKADSNPVFFTFDAKFIKACKQITGKDYLQFLQEANIPGISVDEESDELVLKKWRLSELYRDSVESICQCLNRDLNGDRDLKQISTLYMVGSYSQSDYLKKTVSTTVRTRSGAEPTLVNPPDSHITIVKGALLYGIYPGIIQERVSAYSYGYSTTVKFNPEIHEEVKKVTTEGIDRVHNVYCELIQKSQHIRTDGKQDPIKFTLNPISSTQVSMRIAIYAAEKKVEYVSNPLCKHLLDITVPMTDLTGGRNRVVYVEVTVGGTEISVIAKDKNTGKIVEGKVEFFSQK